MDICTERKEAVQHESDTEMERVSENLSLKVAGRQVQVGTRPAWTWKDMSKASASFNKMWVSVWVEFE